MADSGTVCSMCGDVGFPDKLFKCLRCLSRFQHSYCSNYYDEEPLKTARTCDWCLSEERSSARHGPSSKKQHTGGDSGHISRSGYRSGFKVKRSSEQEEVGTRGKSTGGSSSSKPGVRRYKLLKDVLC